MSKPSSATKLARRLALGLLPLFAAQSLGCDVPPPDAAGSPDEARKDIETVSLAASETGTIPVLDISLPGLAVGTFGGFPNQIQTLDDTDAEVAGTINVYQAHGTPRTGDGSLDLGRIRATSKALTDARIEIKRRGNSSKSFPKKSYSLDLKTATAFLGMPSEKEWALHSCYADTTCLRNVLAYWQAARSGDRWAPRTEFAEVFINGSYRGLYVAIEKIKLGPNRVNLPPADDSYLGVNGTYILERNDTPAAWASFHFPNTSWAHVSPKRTAVSSTQTSTVRSWMDIMEGAFSRNSPAYDPFDYADDVDEKSAADFVIMQELSFNVDGYHKSQYVTKQGVTGGGDGKLHFGPVWDFDLAFGNFADGGYKVCDPKMPEPYVWRIDWHPEIGYPVLQEMWKTWKFRTAVYNRWWELRNNATISRTRWGTKIDAFAARIKDARLRDDRIWNTLRGSTGWECSNKPTFEEEIAALKSFVVDRINYIDEKIALWSFRNP